MCVQRVLHRGVLALLVEEADQLAQMSVAEFDKELTLTPPPSPIDPLAHPR